MASLQAGQPDLPPVGDDQWTHFDTSVLGLRDPEGIAYHPERGTLFIVSHNDPDIVETTITGSLVNLYDIDAFNILSPAGAAIGPGSTNPAVMSIYISDRGVDNAEDPNENDGKVYEIFIGDGGVTPVPTNKHTNTAPPTVLPTITLGPLPTPSPGTGAVYVSLDGGDTIGGIRAEDIDILYFDGSVWSMYFDASDVGISTAGQDMNDFSIINPNTILMSFKAPLSLGGLTVEPWDLVQFNATSLGDVTSGTFSLYFDGYDVGLDTTAEYLDAVDLLSDGRLVISTISSSTVPGVNGQDEDLLAFNPTTLGENTSGTWAMYFDGSDVGLSETSSEEISGVDIHNNGSIYITTLGAFDVTGVTGLGEDILICTPASLGDVTACTFSPELFLLGSSWGIIGNEVNGINVAGQDMP